MAANPLVSVCIPVYNCAPFIAEAIQSVLAQTLTDWELVIVDNASTDGTLDVVKRFAPADGSGDARIRVLRNETNIGAAGNWNRCLDEARGKYIKILPADDLLRPTCLERQARVLEAAENQGVALVCAQRDILAEDGKPIYKGRGLSREGRIPAREAIRLIVRSGGNPIGEGHAILFRASDLPAVGKFDGSAGYLIDLDFFCRVLTRGDLYCIPEPLSAFRVSAGAWSTSVAKSQAAETRKFWKRLKERELIGATDQWIGSVMASVMGSVRQLVYFGLRLNTKPHARPEP
jgi:glycosyltransferase involved in cell wall biosynthesis